MRRQFDEQLEELAREMISMGAMIESAIDKACDALMRHDVALAKSVMEADHLVDQKERTIERDVYKRQVRASRRMDSPPFFHLNTQYSTRPIGWQARAFLLYRKEKGAPKETPPRCAALLLGTETASRAARSAGNTRNKHFFGDAVCSVQISSHKRRPGLSKERSLAAL